MDIEVSHSGDVFRQFKKNPGICRESQGEIQDQTIADRQNALVQPRPADKLDRTPVQIEVSRQYCLNISVVRV
jgi:hypothetical protein